LKTLRNNPFFTIGRYAAKNQFTGRRLDTKKKPITTFGDHLTNRYKEITGGRVKYALIAGAGAPLLPQADRHGYAITEAGKNRRRSL
jgi:hypothetical protein